MMKVTGIDPRILLEESERSEHSGEHVGLRSRLSGSIHRNLDGLVVGGDENCGSIQVEYQNL